MAIRKEITKDNELYLWMNGKLIYKRWLNQGYSKVFDIVAYDKYTYASYKDWVLEDTADLFMVHATLKILTSQEGGTRKSPVYSGYRPNHVFELKDSQPVQTYIGQIDWDELKPVSVGDTREVIVKFPAMQPIEEFLEVNKIWWIYEGPSLIGELIMNSIQLPTTTYKE